MSTATDLDAADPLAHFRERFVGAASDLVYFDGNSLGRPVAATAERLGTFVEEEWGGRLIRGWDERWMDLPTTLGDDLARICLGAAAGQTAIGDSTTVWLYKLMRAAVDHVARTEPFRTEIVIDTDNFPTDRYVAEGIAAERGLSLRWIEVDTAAGVTPEQLREVVGERTALVVLNHVAYRSAWLADAPELTRIAHDAGALVLWDLCHSAGAVEVELDAWDVDLAVGCSYKYLNGGPGSPAFGYVAERLQGELTPADPGLDGPRRPVPDGSGLHAGRRHPAVHLRHAPDPRHGRDAGDARARRGGRHRGDPRQVRRADVVRRRARRRTRCPRSPSRRRATPPGAAATSRSTTTGCGRSPHALWERDVIPDYRDPGGLRIGLSPLSTSFDEVERGIAAVAEALR